MNNCRLKKICNIAFKDFKSYFVSPIGYLIISLFAFIVGFMFYQRMIFFVQQSLISSQFGQPLQVSLNDALVKPLYGTINLIFLFIIPLITMRLISEEKKSKTIELLYTAPIKIWHIVLGKFSASVFFVLILLVFTLVYPLILYIGGNPDFGQIWTMYLGISLVSFLYLAIGLFWSSITENQIIASVLTFISLLFMWIMNWSAQSSSKIGILFSKLSINTHFESFLSGSLNIADTVYFISAISFFLYLTIISLNSKNWE